MHPSLTNVTKNILRTAEAALSQLNHHAIFGGPGTDGWDIISVINAAHAGELFIKAIIADKHPLLIFKNIYSLSDKSGQSIVSLPELMEKGVTHDFQSLPSLYNAVTGYAFPNHENFEDLRKLRNKIQHFCADPNEDFEGISLKFIYNCIDPLINKHFGFFAIEFYQDHVGYDYVVERIVREGLKFSIPDDFDIREVSLLDAFENCSVEYKAWLKAELTKIGKQNLLK